MKKLISLFALVSLLLVSLVSCGNPALKGVKKSDEATDYVLMEVEDYGEILIQLDPNKTSEAIENFKKLVSESFYDGLTFYKVTKNYILQAGDSKSESSQFFITHGTDSYNTRLIASDYVSFGNIIYGIDTIDKIANVTTNYKESPIDTIRIKSINFVTVEGTSFENQDLPTEPPSTENPDLKDVKKTEVPTDYVLMEVEDYGEILIKLCPEEAPITVENFKSLVASGFYDGLTFHRVISGFMIQGGDPKGNGTGGSDKNIVGEFSSNGIENNLKHERGTISMARSNAPDSASSQFFIVHETSTQNTLSLDGKYAAFGTVIYGMETVDAIAKVTTNYNDRPLKAVRIESVRFVSVEGTSFENQ